MLFKSNKFMKKIGILISIVIVLTVVAAVIIAYFGTRDRSGKADIGVVLGTTVYEDRTLSPYLRARLDAAVRNYQEGYFPLIVASGGLGIEGHDEATVMAEYMVAKGIPKDKVIIDSMGNNTGATAQNLKKIMDERGLKSAFVITQFFHVPRSRLALSCMGIDPIYSDYAHYWNIRDLYSVLREVPAFALYWLRCE